MLGESRRGGRLWGGLATPRLPRFSFGSVAMKRVMLLPWVPSALRLGLQQPSRLITSNAKQTLGQYFKGAQQLWSDVGRAWALRNVLPADLSRKDALIKRDAPRDLWKVLPLVLNPLPPPLGWALILFAYQNPRTMLSPQFWSEQDKAVYFEADEHTKRERYQRLVEACSSQGGVLQELAHVIATSRAGMPLRGTSLSALLAPFEEGQSLGLDVLDREKLTFLAAAVLPVLTVETVRRLPPAVLRAQLRQVADDLRADDHHLVREGAASLLDAELRDACAARGLHQAQRGNEARVELETWLTVLGAFEQARPDGRLPACFVLFAPALFSANATEPPWLDTRALQ